MKIARKHNPLSPHIHLHTCPTNGERWMDVYYPREFTGSRMTMSEYRQGRAALAFARSMNFKDNTHANNIYKQEAQA